MKRGINRWITSAYSRIAKIPRGISNIGGRKRRYKCRQLHVHGRGAMRHHVECRRRAERRPPAVRNVVKIINKWACTGGPRPGYASTSRRWGAGPVKTSRHRPRGTA